METKLFEVRDRATFIPVLAVRLKPGCEEDRYLLARSGYGRSPADQGRYVYMSKIAGGSGRATCDPNDWGHDGTRTLAVAHAHIVQHWGNLLTGDVLDVEFILGEATAPKVPERLSAPV
jgi:hypothetical protein